MTSEKYSLKIDRITPDKHKYKLLKPVEKLADFVVKKFGQIDIWINNAGIWLPHLPIEETNWKRAHDLMEVNLFGTVYGSKVALAEMKKKNFGIIINIVSTFF